MTRRFVMPMGWCLVVLLAARALGQTPPAADAPAQGPMRVTITGVVGMVQVREGADRPWVRAAVNMVVTEGAEFRTGPHAAVRCLIPPDQTITLDRLGTIKLMQAIRDGNVVKTRVGMPYGRTRYDIEEAGIEHRAELVSPSSTLAVRGTQVSITDQPPYAPSAVSLTGTAQYRTGNRQVTFGAKGQGRTDVNANGDSAAAVALSQTYVDPQSAFGRPAADQRLITNVQTRADLFLTSGQAPALRGAAAASGQLAQTLADQGRFNISLSWTGPGDFSLFVLGTDAATKTPYTLGDPAYPGSIFKDAGVFGLDPRKAAVTTATSPDGGRIQFTPITLGGGRHVEFATFGSATQGVPQQGYTIAVLYRDRRGNVAAYPVRSDFQVTASLDGRRIPLVTNLLEVTFGQQPSLTTAATYAGTASLVPAEQLLPSPVIPGDVRVTAVDLSSDALDLAGRPLGDINVATTVTAKAAAAGGNAGARVVSGKTAAGRAVVPVGPKPTRGR